jgi:hypothetical protein
VSIGPLAEFDERRFLAGVAEHGQRKSAVAQIPNVSRGNRPLSRDNSSASPSFRSGVAKRPPARVAQQAGRFYHLQIKELGIDATAGIRFAL